MWIAMLALTAAFAGCIKPQQPPAPAAAAPEAPKVLVEVPQSGDITDYEDFTGRTVATKTIDIRARVTGYLTKINFSEKEGQDVEQNSVLFEIDPRPYQAEMARTEAGFLQAQSHLKRIDLDYQRAAKTVDKKVITQEQFDLVTGDRNEARSAVEVARANRDMAKLNLSFTKVRAPISGRVSRTQLDVGNLVRADETILTTVVSMDPIYAYFDVDERTMLRLRRYAEEGRIRLSGDRATAIPVGMGLADEDGFPHGGVVNFVDNRLDPSSGTLQLRGIFKNADRMLSPGMFVRVRLPIGNSYRALLVSEQALGTDQGQKFVYVIDQENKAQYRRVQVGKLQQGHRVILKGLEAEERIVVSGLQRIRPGAVVQPMIEPTADASRDHGAAVAEAPTAGGGMSQK
jgi:RND family efflux transporter MFP subunit